MEFERKVKVTFDEGDKEMIKAVLKFIGNSTSSGRRELSNLTEEESSLCERFYKDLYGDFGK